MHAKQRLSLIVLCASLVIVGAVFGVRVKYAPGVYYALAGIQLIVICIAAWKLGAWAIRAETEERRRLALAGALLVTPWALFSFLPGIGPPGDQTHAENALRYLILLINSIAIAGGLVVLREALSEAGERFYSTLGFAAILLAAPLYLVWAALALEYFRAADRMSAADVRPAVVLLADLMDILLFFGGALTYIATAAFAASLGRAQWLERSATRAFVTASVVALLFLVIRGLEFPDPAMVVTHWFTIPGYVVGIPAVPWIMPVLFGVILLWRAGAEQHSRQLSNHALRPTPEDGHG